MTRLFNLFPVYLVALLVCLVAVPVCATDPTPPLTETVPFADAESTLLLALDANPTHDGTRFGLGVIQFLRAVENLGKALFEYGAVTEKLPSNFQWLAVPKNERPSAISYTALCRVLDVFAAELGRAEATLACIKNDNVKLRLRLAKISFDFTGTGKERTTLIDLLTKHKIGRYILLKADPDFRVHFDRGDVAWLRAYCHSLAALVEGFQAIDVEPGLDVRGVFPTADKADWISDVVDAPRLRRMRLHLLAVCELNRETWEHIRKEADDELEWLTHPKQWDRLGLPLTDELIEAWLARNERWEGLLKGERLVAGAQLLGVAHPEGRGLNIKKLLDDPPADLYKVISFQVKAIDGKYWDLHEGRQLADVWEAITVMQLCSPFGFVDTLEPPNPGF